MRASCLIRSLSGLCVTVLLALSMACGGGSNTTSSGNTTGSPGTSNPPPGGTGTSTGGATTGGTTTGGSSTGGGGSTTGGSTGTTSGGTGTTGGTGGATTGGGGTSGGGSGQQGQQFLFVAEEQTIQPFAIGADGSLSASAGVGTIANPAGTVTDMAGNSNRLYAVIDPGNGGSRGGTIASFNDLFGFSIDASSGSLTSTPGSPYKITTFPQKVVLHPNGDVLVTLEFFDINSYHIANDGSASAAFSENYFARFNFSQPSDIKLSPSGDFLYVSSIRDNLRSDSKSGIATYRVDHATGMLTALGNLVELPEAPRTLGITPSGKFLYAFTNDPFATTPRPDKIFAFNINGDGTLTPLTGSPFTAVGGGEQQAVMTPSGSYMLVRNFTFQADSGIVVYKINSDGRPIAIPASPFPVAEQAPSGLAIDKTGNFVYATDLNGKKVYGWKFDDNTGTLSPLRWSPLSGLNFPSVITITSTK